MTEVKTSAVEVQSAMTEVQATAAEGKSATVDCLLCGKKDVKKSCGVCGLARYCSVECQRKHWSIGGHKQACKPPQRHQTFKSPEDARPALMQYRAKKGPTVSRWHDSKRGTVTWFCDVRPGAYPPEHLFPMSVGVTCRQPVRDDRPLRPLFLGPAESSADRIRLDREALGERSWKEVGDRLDALIRGLAGSTKAVRADALFETIMIVGRAHFQEITAEDAKALTRVVHKSWQVKRSWTGSDFLSLVPTNPLWNVWDRKEAVVELGDGGTFLVSEVTWGGAQQCPLQRASDHTYYGFDFGNKDWVIQNQSTKQRIWLPSLTVHMMLCHGGFCQGAGCTYRIEPKQLVDVLFGTV